MGSVFLSFARRGAVFFRSMELPLFPFLLLMLIVGKRMMFLAALFLFSFFFCAWRKREDFPFSSFPAFFSFLNLAKER